MEIGSPGGQTVMAHPRDGIEDRLAAVEGLRRDTEN
jgi:hypothetical protein